MIAKFASGLAVFAAAACLAGMAEAHAHLVTAVPAVDGTAPASTNQIQINFSEEVFPRFSGIVLKTAAGKTVSTGKSAVDEKDHRVMTVPISGSLAPGAYEVSWHSVSEDTHRKEGKYRFTVQ